MTYNEFKNRSKEFKNIKEFDFVNKHGEKFKVIWTDLSLLITGDEYDWEVMSLFNHNFSIYSKEELKELGKILTNLGG